MKKSDKKGGEKYTGMDSGTPSSTRPADAPMGFMNPPGKPFTLPKIPK